MKYFLTAISIFGLAITLSAEKNPKSTKGVISLSASIIMNNLMLFSRLIDLQLNIIKVYETKIL